MAQDGTDGQPGTNGKSIVVDTTTITYANDSQGVTPPSSGWSGTASPQPGEYTWTKIYTTYKFEGTSTSAGTSTAYSVAYTGVDGDDGVSATNVTCGNEAQGIQCNTSGATTSASTIQIPYAGYVGDNRAAASVVVTDLPTGITVDNTSTPATTSADGLLKLSVANNSTLGGSASGTITLTFTCNSKTFVKKFAWSKIVPGANGTSVTIASQSIQYKLTDETIQPTTGWEDVMPTLEAGKYL